jgi:gamma-butyrobetaine dioxygenase
LQVQQSSSAAAAAVTGLQQQQRRRVEVTLARLQRNLELTWAHGKSSSFPLAWLRDNCQCPSCFHPVSRSRTVDWATCDVTVKPKHVQVVKFRVFKF